LIILETQNWPSLDFVAKLRRVKRLNTQTERERETEHIDLKDFPPRISRVFGFVEHGGFIWDSHK